MEKLQILLEKLKVPEPSVQRNTVRQIVKHCIHSKTLQNEYVKTLYRLVNQGSLTVSYEATEGIIELVKNNKLNGIQVLNKFISDATNIQQQNLSHLLNGILGLLEMDTKRVALVTLVNNRKEIIYDLIYKTPELILTKDGKLNLKMFEIISPLFANILSNETQAIHLIREFVKIGISSKDNLTSNCLLLYLYHFMPLFSVEVNDIHTSCIQPCSEIIDLLINTEMNDSLISLMLR